MATTNHQFNDQYIAEKVEAPGLTVLERELIVSVNFDAPASNAIETATIMVTRTYKVQGSVARDLLREAL
ncbi:ribosomal protein S25 [Frigoribacterium sp. PvP054]|uniref:hypothetical protein n=1 Tax=Frigoribacterium sp. PvP054 TaxID=3156438 RepID=UPI0033993F08